MVWAQLHLMHGRRKLSSGDCALTELCLVNWLWLEIFIQFLGARKGSGRMGNRKNQEAEINWEIFFQFAHCLSRMHKEVNLSLKWFFIRQATSKSDIDYSLPFYALMLFIDFSVLCPMMQYQSDWIGIFSLWDYTRNLRNLTDACIRPPNLQRLHKMNKDYIICTRKRGRNAALMKALCSCWNICRNVGRSIKSSLQLRDIVQREQQFKGLANVYRFSAGLCNASFSVLNDYYLLFLTLFPLLLFDFGTK